MAREICENVRIPKKVENVTAAANEGEYAHCALQASGGTYPYWPGTAVVQEGVGRDTVVDAILVEVVVTIVCSRTEEIQSCFD